MSWVTPVSAALLAVLLSSIELGASRKKGLSLKALHWLLLRFSIDGGTAALVYPAIVSALSGLSWFTGPWPVLLSAFAGPALLRSQLALLGSGEESSYFGPATVYRRLQTSITRAIDDITSVSQTEWIESRALPALSSMPLDRVLNAARAYIGSLDRLSQAERKDELRFLTEVENDNSALGEKYEVVILRLLDVGGRRLVRSLTKTGNARSGFKGTARPAAKRGHAPPTGGAGS